MSVEMLSRVFWTDIPTLSYVGKNGKEVSVKSTTSKIVLLAIADNADEYGENSFQSFETLATKSSIERRSVIRVVRALIVNGYLKAAGVSEYGTNKYSIAPDRLGVRPATRPRNGRPKTSDPETETSDLGAKTSDPKSPEPYLNRPLTIGAKPAPEDVYLLGYKVPPVSGGSGEEYVPLEEEPVSNKIIVPTTITAFYLSNQQIGRWKNCWKGFKNRKQEREWLQMESLYNPETIKQKIDWAVQEGIPPSRIASSIITALKNNVKPDKPEEGTTWESVPILSP